jgi:hypothetical protein
MAAHPKGWAARDTRGLLRTVARGVEHAEIPKHQNMLLFCMINRKMYGLHGKTPCKDLIYRIY